MSTRRCVHPLRRRGQTPAARMLDTPSGLASRFSASRSSKIATRDTATRPSVSYVTNMGETRNPENPEPMTAAERMRRHRARQVGDDVPKVKPEPKPRKPQTLREASLEELIDEVSDRLTGRMADDREIRA